MVPCCEGGMLGQGLWEEGSQGDPGGEGLAPPQPSRETGAEQTPPGAALKTLVLILLGMQQQS